MKTYRETPKFVSSLKINRVLYRRPKYVLLLSARNKFDMKTLLCNTKYVQNADGLLQINNTEKSIVDLHCENGQPNIPQGQVVRSLHILFLRCSTCPSPFCHFYVYSTLTLLYRLPHDLQLAVFTTLIATLTAIKKGTTCCNKKNSRPEKRVDDL